ncbi:tetratricopeptide repeat-containing sensor histidine kinase [Roseivirga pacifica]|uniref:tetratricopeptide repeat-containing sensor histidine kinase n=1 Tax=Roseivirga pacifica TaxID=1267423 RepID=UPI0020943906|nr:sensor histidine kinase [Roseivirga pacifica]
MKKIFTCTALWLCLVFSINAQESSENLLNKFTHFSLSDADSARIVQAKIDTTSFNTEQKIRYQQSLGRVLSLENKYEEAVAVYIESLKSIPENASFAKLISEIYDDIGSIYNSNLKDFNLAETYYLEALNVRQRFKLNSELGMSFYSLGTIAFRRSEHYKAIGYFKQGLNSISGESQLSIAANLNYMTGMAYARIADETDPAKLDSAVTYLKSAKGMYRAMGNAYYEGVVTMEEAGILLQLGQYAECAKSLEQILSNDNIKKDIKMYIRIFAQLSIAYEGLKDYKRAFEYKRLEADSFRVELSNNRLSSIAQITEDFRTDKQLDEAEATAFFASRKARIFSIVVIVLAIVLVISYLIFVQTLQKKKLENLQAMVMGEEQERKRVAKDLHDGIGVLLTSVKLRLSNFEDKVDDKKAYQDSLQQIDNACTEVRRISHNMVPASLTKLGIEEAILDLLDNVKASTQIEINEDIQVEEGLLAEEKEVLIYRIIQELINNSIKYAEASTVSLSIKNLRNEVKITYKDDGKGFDKSEIKAGIGLKSIASRIDILKGKLNITTAPGTGVQFDINLPLYG